MNAPPMGQPSTGAASATRTTHLQGGRIYPGVSYSKRVFDTCCDLKFVDE